MRRTKIPRTTNGREDDARRAYRKGLLRAGRASATVTLAIAAGLWAHGADAIARRVDASASACDAAIAAATSEADAGRAALGAVTDGDLADPSTRSDLADALEALDRIDDGTPVRESGSLALWAAQRALDGNEALRKDVERATARSIAARDAMAASKHRHDLDVARDSLSDAIGAARDKVARTAGNVVDDAVRETLARACDDADRTIEDASVDDVGIYTNAKAVIDDASTKVDASVEEKRRADEAAARARSVSENGARAVAASASADTWTVSYRNEYGTRAAASDGAVTQWADGYFIAHDWSMNGKRIASKPTRVIVDGRAYRYVGAREIPRGSYYEDYEGWVHAAGGIGFQTCVHGGGYLVTRYDPE